MAKIIDYPRASLTNGLQLAETVNSLGGSAKTDLAAERMGRKISGAFSAVISAAVKYGLIYSKEGRLSTTQLFRDIKLSYSEHEQKQYLAKALLSPPIFQSIAQRFEGKHLPVEHFDRLLIREFDVSEEIAPRVASYFLDGASQAGLLGVGNIFMANNLTKQVPAIEAEVDEASAQEAGPIRESSLSLEPESVRDKEPYSVTFRGPGLMSTVALTDEEDLAIVEAMLRKIAKAMKMTS